MSTQELVPPPTRGSDRVAIRQLPTGVPGLDEILGGIKCQRRLSTGLRELDAMMEGGIPEGDSHGKRPPR